MDSGTDWLCEILQNVQLEQFYVPIRDQLQITRLAHFDYVHVEDLERIGISKPGVRRLFDAVRKKKLQLWNRKFWNKLFGSSNSMKEKADITPRPATQTETRTTCIILEKDIVNPVVCYKNRNRLKHNVQVDIVSVLCRDVSRICGDFTVNGGNGVYRKIEHAKRLHNELGTGSFGVVKRGEWSISEQGQSIPVAVKVLKADAFSQPGIYDDFRREVEAMHSLKHANLIKLHGVVFHPLMMVCELAPMGALLDYIRTQNGKVSLHYISKWSMQVAAGMAHLEKNRFLHRDLACRNILLSNLELVKIGDFGLMRALPDADDCYVMSERRRVPFPWCAPESLRARHFSHASDVWMFAVALWEMYTFGEEPWIGLNGSEILRLLLREGQRLAAPAACPPDVCMLMMQCWDLNPKERPTFAGIQRYMETNKFETAVAALSYRRQGQMSVDASDAIILIDKRPELHWWKGQNQRTLEVGLFPSTILAKSKITHSTKKSQTLSPVQKVEAQAQSNGALDDSAVVLRKRRTAESAQRATTRAERGASKQFNYNKLVNDRAAFNLGDRVTRTARDEYSKSLNQVKEDLLIDLDLPPSTRAPSKRTPVLNNVSILDEPIDVPQVGLETAWAQQSTESLPTYSSNFRAPQTYSNMYGAKSMENLASPTHGGRTDPFDTSQFWPSEQAVSKNCDIQAAKYDVQPVRPNYDVQPVRSNYDVQPVRPNYDVQPVRPDYDVQPVRPNYDVQPVRPDYDVQPVTNDYDVQPVRPSCDIQPIRQSYDTQLEPSTIVSQQKESHRYSTNNYASTSDNSHFNNRTVVNRNNSPYGTIPESSCTYANANALSIERNMPNVAKSLAEMSLDDRISESLNLRKNENLYSNSPYNSVPSTSAGPSNVNETRFNDIPIYSNFDINPAQQQLLLETKDYYTKYSTPAKTNPSNDYEKNIYVPKYEEEAEKLKNFSERLENSKNYSALKYQNIDYGYPSYSNNSSTNSASRGAITYDEVNDTAGNIYSEIGESPNHNVYGTGQNVYTNACLYDEVYEETSPRPHRPAPPCPSKPK